jgi:ectoine hydroxylase-related dioxygenase (phytanoyl-CoA dioxygenase family)
MSAALTLTAEQIALFWERGFLTLDAMTTPAEVATLREIFDRLFAARTGWEKGRAFDLAGRDEAGAPLALPQILQPVEFAPELAHTQFRENARAVAQQLLGPGAELWFEHAICKPAQFGAATPWHQDEAHRSDRDVEYEQVSFWMPLQPATVENGCMHYVPGSHRGPVLEHRSLDGDARKPALECVGSFDRALAERCPLPAGGAALHHSKTLHGAGPNTTSETRRAYILVFRGALRPASSRAPYPWLVGKTTAAGERAAAWQDRGGAVGRTARRVGHWAGHFAARLRRKVGALFPRN